MSKDEIAVRDETSPMMMAQNFLNNGGDLANLEKMMELQERHEKNQARKAYHVAMAEFKKDPPRLEKTKEVAYNSTKFKHATLGSVTEVINQSLAKCGLSAGWKTEQESGIKVTCTITHALGYSESTSLVSPPDNSGGKNNIQGIGSTITYLQRYTLLALTGLAAHDQDDDGKGAEGDDGNQNQGEKPKPFLKPNDPQWATAKAAYTDSGKIENILKHVQMTDEHQKQFIQECGG